MSRIILQTRPNVPGQAIKSNPPIMGGIRSNTPTKQKPSETNYIDQKELLRRGDITQYANINPPTESKQIEMKKFYQVTGSSEASNIIINDLKRQIIENKENLIKAESTINELKQQIESTKLSRTIEEKDKVSTIKILQKDLAKVKSDYTLERGDLSKKISELTSGKSTLDSTHAKTVSKLNECLKEKAKTELLLNESREELKTVKIKLDVLKVELTNEKRNKSTEEINKRRINDLEADIEKLKNTETQLNVDLKRLSNEHEKLKQKLEKIEGKKKRAEEMIEFQKQALVLANSELKARDSQIGLLQKQRDEILEKCQGQKKELENEKVKLDLKYKKLLKSSLSVNERKVENEKVKLDLKYKKLLKSSLSVNERKVDQIQKAKLKIEKELEEKDKLLQESEESFKKIKKEIEVLKKLESSKLQFEERKEKIISELRQQIDNLKKDNERTENILSDIRSQLSTCNSSNASLTTENKELTIVRNKLQGNLTKCKQRYNENKQTIKELQQQKKNIESRLSSQSSGEMDLLESKSLLEDRIKRLDSQLTGLNSEQERLKTLKSGLETQLQTCNSSNANLQREKEKLNNQLETCRKQRKTVENHLNERIKNLNTQIYELKSEKQYLEQSRSEFKTKSKDRIGYEQEQFNDQIRKLNEIIRLKDEEISNVKEELENLRKEYNEKERQLLSEIERKNSEIEKLEGRLQASEFILKTEREDSQRLLERIKELDLARKDAEEVNKSIENDRIELQRGITSKHVEIQRLERELDSLKRKLTELENNPAADFDAYNQGMEEAKQNYIQKIQELQSRISGFDTEKKQMEIQLEECTKVRLELSSKINDLEKLVGNLKLENEKLKLENENLVKQVKDREAGSVKLNEKLKLENENLVKQVKDREAGSVKLNEKLKVENQKLIKEREMYSSQFQQTQKLQADNTRYEEIVKSLQEKLQSEILKNRGEKSVIENEYRQSLETIEELNKQLETSKKLLSENSSKLLQTQQMQALQSFQSSQASQDKIKELENINNLLREEITKISEQLRLKNSEISREGSSRILEIKNEEERLTGILKRLNTEIGFSEHQLRQLQENISKKKDISVVSSFNLSINDEEYDRIQRIIRNVERVTKKCDKLSVSKMNK